jgi:hypothetical protein
LLSAAVIDNSVDKGLNLPFTTDCPVWSHRSVKVDAYDELRHKRKRIEYNTSRAPDWSVTYHVSQVHTILNTFVQMASIGQINADSLVWKAGMPQCTKAGTVDELKGFFANIPPVPPNSPVE